MFTGIIQDIGTVRALDRQKGLPADQQGDWRIRIATALPLQDKAIGASIACAGCCLTVLDKGQDWFDVEASSETLSKTNLKNWQEGTQINLEPALKTGDELGGHIVSGHVDGLACIKSITPQGDSHTLTLAVPESFAPYVAPKGSITLDGISLTINEVEGATFSVNIISHTWQVTTLGGAAVGDTLNFEVDMLARYVARQMAFLSRECP